MPYMIVMSKPELCAILALLGERTLSDLIEIQNDYLPGNDDETVVSDFTRMIIWTAVHCESELRIDAEEGFHYRLFFQGDTIILLTLSKDDVYVLDFLSTIPEAVGGLASVLGWLEHRMNDLDIISKEPPEKQMQTDISPCMLKIDGWLLTEHNLSARLLKKETSYQLSWNWEDTEPTFEEVDFYSLIQELIPWIVNSHSLSIQGGIRNDTV